MLNEFLWIHILQVTRKHDHIRVLCQHTVDITFQQPFSHTCHRSDVCIRKLDDTVAVESCRQVFATELDMTDLQLLIPYEHAIDGEKED